MEVQLELFPCPICKRKFIKKSLEVHLRSCDKQGKYHKIDKGYDNSAFIANLDKAMAAEHNKQKEIESKKLTEIKNNSKEKNKKKPKEEIKPKQKKIPLTQSKINEESNKAFMDKLEAELAKEEENQNYQPSKEKKVTKKKNNKDNNYTSNINEESNKAFLAKFEAEMKKEEENSSYIPSKPKIKNKKDSIEEEIEDSNKKFLENLNKELKKEEEKEKEDLVNYDYEKEESDKEEREDKNYKNDDEDDLVNIKDQNEKENENENENEEEEINKKEEKEKEYEKPKYEIHQKKKDYAKKEFELAKERASKNKQISNAELICYFCFKKINSKNYVFHVHDCEAQWKIKNLNKDPSIFKPKDFDLIVSKVSALTKEQIDSYNENVLENKDGMTLIPCENCARNIMKCQMEEHLKNCKPMESYVNKNKNEENEIKNNNNEAKYDIDSYIKEEEETLASMELIPCDKCGRKFAPDRLPVHERGCHGKK
jgi:hypothetical protein